MLFGGGGGPITEDLPGVGVQGEKKEHSSQGNRRTKGPINFEGKGTLGNRENMWNKGTGTIFPPWEGLISSL